MLIKLQLCRYYRHNRKSKREERLVLEQGLSVPPPPPCAALPLPPPVQRLTVMPLAPLPQPFVFTLPPNTAGQACSIRPPPPLLPRPLFLPDTTGPQVEPLLPAAPFRPLPSSIPRSTRWYQKKKREREEAGIYCKKYQRVKETMMCRRCGKERSSDSHHQYYGNWYCQETVGMPYGQWLMQFADKGYGRKKKD